ncbi:MAG TPA: glycosyltransferase family 1 protein [Firmicutes bacterium]|nr:glycosyltransferase family 1 protein [Bacillota bacterium]
MRVLVVSHSSVLKYHQEKLLRLSENHGVEIVLAAPPFWHEGGAKVPLYTGNTRIKYFIGKTLQAKYFLTHLYLNAGYIVRRVNPDIVHIEEEPFNAACVQFVSAAKKYGKKSIFFTWENIRRKFGPLREFMWNHSVKNTDAVITGNKEAAEIIQEKCPGKKTAVIPQYGIDMDSFLPRQEIIPQGRPFKILYAGRLIPEKGIDTLLNAVNGIKGASLDIAGTGNETYCKMLKKAAGDNVKFTGRVDSSEMPRFLTAYDILVLPSRTTKNWKEQFGRVLIEAFASRVAVIGSDSGEIPNVIGESGLVFREGNAEELRAQIKKYMEDKKLYAEKIESGYERVNASYTNDGIARSIYGLYKELI